MHDKTARTGLDILAASSNYSILTATIVVTRNPQHKKGRSLFSERPFLTSHTLSARSFSFK